MPSRMRDASLFCATTLSTRSSLLIESRMLGFTSSTTTAVPCWLAWLRTIPRAPTASTAHAATAATAAISRRGRRLRRGPAGAAES